MKKKNIPPNHVQIATGMSQITSNQYQGIPANLLKDLLS